MSEFFSGSLDPFWPHSVLLTAAIVASFVVAAGIVLENPTISLANVLVVSGVAIEAACTLLLFGFDEGMSKAQQSKIALLDTELLRVRSPRWLKSDVFDKEIAEIRPKGDAEILYDPAASDGMFIGIPIAAAMSIAGWHILPNGVPIRLSSPSPDDPLAQYKNSAQAAGGQPWGISVVTNAAHDPGNKTPGTALMLALAKALPSGTQVSLGADSKMPSGRLRVVIGQRLP